MPIYPDGAANSLDTQARDHKNTGGCWHHLTYRNSTIVSKCNSSIYDYIKPNTSPYSHPNPISDPSAAWLTGVYTELCTH